MAEQPVDLALTAGLPYARRVRVNGAAVVWPAMGDFEVRSHIRSGRLEASPLLRIFTPFITPSIEGSDIVLDVVLTGADTRTIPSGYYDVILSDAGTIDQRALRVLRGKIKVSGLVTAVTDE